MDQQTLKKILDASLDMYLVLDRNGTLLEYKPSRNFDPLLPPAEFLGRSVEEVLPPELAEATLAKTQTVLGSGEESVLEYDLPLNGSLSSFEARFSPIDTESVLVIVRDVTEKVRMQKALEEREEQYRRLFEYNPMPMFVSDSETWEILNVNQAAVNHYGYGKEELLNMTLKDIRPPEDVESLMRRIGAVSAPVENMGVFRHLKKDGTTVLMNVYSHEVLYEGRKARLALCHDVTDQIRAKETLEESEEMFRKSFFLSSDAMSVSRIEDGVLLEVNDGFTRTTGYSREDAVGKTTIELGMWADGSRRSVLIREFRKKGRVENFEYEMRTKGGETKTVLLSTNIITLGGAARRFTITRDITKLKIAEEALLRSEEKLRASLREKEILLKEIHHRVKNNLQVVSGLLDLQASHTQDPSDRLKYKDSQNRIITMALIHEKLYQSQNLSQVDFSDYIRDLCENLMVSYGIDEERIRLEIQTERTEMAVDSAIPCGFLINELITNALKHAFPEDRAGTISLSFKRTRNRDYQLTVSDDGVGIPKDLDIFNTDSLGMQLVTVLVKQLGGTIKLRKEEGTGITIRFREYHEAGTVLF